MKSKRSYGYINYGPIPKKEYDTAYSGMNTDEATVTVYAPGPDETAYMHRLIKRQAKHPSGRRQKRGWVRAWNTNGWRAESAALQDVFEYAGGEEGHA